MACFVKVDIVEIMFFHGTVLDLGMWNKGSWY